MIKAIFFDIDGTLVSFNTHEIPASTKKALTELREKGIRLFIATGRHKLAINNLGDEVFDGFVTMNGSYCIDQQGKTVYKHRIPTKDIERLRHYLNEDESFPCILVQERSMLLNYKNEKVEEVLDLLNFPQPPIGDFRKVPADGVYQLIAFFDVDQEKRIMEILSGCESTRWCSLFTDVVPSGSNKSVGIDRLLEYYGISIEETMAFGDGGNDIAMLEHVGLGVAMGNSDDKVKQSADYVTDSVDCDGIYNALKRFYVI
ncbi:MAG: Cof-type HAD-IIB family hydrolase [Massilibacteroides sp.]|nr:Cof-type HAD-IIB family hydrolase [Massilibacteroides sp.]MDD3061647.1 Cof-type HAD-IIB family hydrolase [Massilibacteroides sp.]MDD4114310.1 Cof-type HAD-IIB family hydrolase [Massilibacteroides sp.]MDD4659969.1 Cof-type HAD-IIB family hydrolase [Massilibacteroides sp.]